MTNVAHVIQQKFDQSIYTIAPDASITEAVVLMATKDIGALIVTEGQQVVGILSERDCARKIIMRDLPADNTQVCELMTSAVISVRLHNSVEECLKLMTDRHLRHLPVLENEKLVGFISIGDLVKAAMEDQRVLIEQLQQYISG